MENFNWIKKGRVFCPDGRYNWMLTHSQNPAALLLEDRIRVYFNCRPARDSNGNVSAHATFVDLDANDPARVIRVHDRPILSLGEPGTFDQFGVMAATVVEAGSEIFLYYVGWTRSVGVPYHHAIGLAVSKDDGINFERIGKGPVITRTPAEPFIQNSPYVTKIGDTYHMWYSSGTGWIQHGEGVESVYVLMHATSRDGIHWERDGAPCMQSRVEHECQTNPTVICLGNRYHMWFCYRCGIDFRNAERGYRIGYAWSDDLVTWHREDVIGELLPSSAGWDSEMVCYPCVVEVNGRILMFYSGNNFGESGFGYAELDIAMRDQHGD